MNKQIEEMTKVICHAPTCEIRKNGGTCYKYCKAYIYAFRAINAGYRKASEVAREILEAIKKKARHNYLLSYPSKIMLEILEQDLIKIIQEVQEDDEMPL